MRRRQRRPGTHLLRAGERTQVFKSDTGVPQVRFRAMTLKGKPEGRVDIETGDPSEPTPETRDLAAENLIDQSPVLSISVVPVNDTAITFVGQEQKNSIAMLLLGIIVVAGATVWTALEFFGG